MSIIDDVLKAFDRIPIWKRLQEIPAETDALKQRVADIEEKLNGKWPADVCRFCGERAVRLDRSLIDGKGMVQEHWQCAKCEKEDVRLLKAH
jgi:ribosomal protein L37AE/L43A